MIRHGKGGGRQVTALFIAPLLALMLSACQTLPPPQRAETPPQLRLAPRALRPEASPPRCTSATSTRA